MRFGLAPRRGLGPSGLSFIFGSQAVVFFYTDVFVLILAVGLLAVSIFAAGEGTLPCLARIPHSLSPFVPA